MIPHHKNFQHGKQSTTSNLFSSYAEEKQELQDLTCWKTNLMLPSQQIRVEDRTHIFKKRTSFQNSLMQQHLANMLKIVTGTQLAIRNDILPASDKTFQHMRIKKAIPEIYENTYLTEHQKWEYTNTILTNHENFSIFTRLSSLFLQNKQQLVYILAQILHFTTADMVVQPQSSTTQQGILSIMENSQLKLVDRVVNHEVIKLVGPAFFSNINELPLMAIVNGWFYHVLGIKQGLYGQEFEAETCQFEPEGNLEDIDLQL